MCDLFGSKQSPSQSTTPTYIPPAQSAVSGGGAVSPAQPAPGVQVKGTESRSRSGFMNRVRRSGGSEGQVDTGSNRRRKRTASSSLGL